MLYSPAMLVRRVVAPLSVFVALASIAGPAAADRAKRPFRTEKVWVDPIKDLAPDAVARAEISKTLFINRCAGGCTITPGENDARANTSSIVGGTPKNLAEFAGTDETFDAVVACVRDLYGPYDVNVVTEDPGSEVFHHEAILAGTPEELGLEGGIGGIAPAACDALNNVISFSFGNLSPDDVEQLCWTVAQESAHSFGLPNHVFDACDPMTYLPGCYRKYFRNKSMKCGEFAVRACDCGGSGQNSHVELLKVFGPGEAPPASEVLIVAPAADQTVTDDFTVFFYATNTRLVDKVELWVNGTKYASQAGHDDANRNNDYNFAAPELPDGYLDLEIKAYDEIGTIGSATVTVLKGAPCSSADSCFEYQECSADGRCKYPPAEGLYGDECVFDQYCLEGTCTEHAGERRCAQTCNPSVAGACPEGFECVDEGGCFPPSTGGGCCSVAGTRRRDAFPLIALGLFGAVFVVIRQRRRG